MANATMCAYPQSEHSLPHWKCVLRCCNDCPCINIPDQEISKKMTKLHPQLGFTFITSLDVVLFMVDFHWKTSTFVLCVNKNLLKINLQRYTPENNSLWWRQPYLIFIPVHTYQPYKNWPFTSDGTKVEITCNIGRWHCQWVQWADYQCILHDALPI